MSGLEAADAAAKRLAVALADRAAMRTALAAAAPVASAPPETAPAASPSRAPPCLHCGVVRRALLLPPAVVCLAPHSRATEGSVRDDAALLSWASTWCGARIRGDLAPCVAGEAALSGSWAGIESSITARAALMGRSLPPADYASLLFQAASAVRDDFARSSSLATWAEAVADAVQGAAAQVLAEIFTGVGDMRGARELSAMRSVGCGGREPGFGIPAVDAVRRSWNGSNAPTTAHAASAGAPLLWDLLCDAAGCCADFASPVAQPLSGTLESFFTASRSLVHAVATHADALDHACLSAAVESCAWLLLAALSGTRGYTPQSVANRPRTIRAVSVLREMVSSPPLAIALTSSAAFVGLYPLAIVPPWALSVEAALAALTAAGDAGLPPFAAQLPQLPPTHYHSFGFRGRDTDAAPGVRLECGTLLGCLLAPSHVPPYPNGAGGSLSPSLATFAPGGIRLTNVTEVDAATITLRSASASAMSPVTAIVDALLTCKGTSAPREAVLSWVGAVLGVNDARAKEQWDEALTSSSGLMLNLTGLLCRLCEPLTLGSSPLLAVQPRESTVGEGGEAGHVAVWTRPTPTDRSDKVAFINAVPLLLQGGVVGRLGTPPYAQHIPLEPLLDLTSDTSPPFVSATTRAEVTAAAASAATSAMGAGGVIHPPPHFVSRVFFLTLQALRLGLSPLLRDRRSEASAISTYLQQARDVEARGPLVAGGGSGDGFEGASAVQLRGHASLLCADRLACDASRLDPVLLASALRFSAVALEWLCRVCGGAVGFEAASTGAGATLPFPTQPPPAATLLPAYYLASLLDILDAVGTSEDPASALPLAPDIVIRAASILPPLCGSSIQHSATQMTPPTSSACDALLRPILAALTAFLAAPPGYVRSPHLRAAIGGALFALHVPPEARPGRFDLRPEEPPPTVLSRDWALLSSALNHPGEWVAAHFSPALMRLYCGVDATGAVERLGHRMRAAALLGMAWDAPPHKRAFYASAHRAMLEGEGGGSGEEDVKMTTGSEEGSPPPPSAFLAFAHALLSHTSSALDDALKGLPILRAGMAGATAPTPGRGAVTTAAAAARLAEVRAEVRGSLRLLSQTAHLLTTLSAHAIPASAFLDARLCGRLSTLLAQALMLLTGPRGLELRVEAGEAEALGWAPRMLLEQLLTCMLHLHTASIAATAADASEEDDLLDEPPSPPPCDAWTRALCNEGLLEAEPWRRLLATAERVGLSPLLPKLLALGSAGDAAAKEIVEAERLACRAPIEFLDPLLHTLLTDPVRSPSGHVYERASILQHLMSDPRDPYSRAPLAPRDLVPVPELRERVRVWVRGQRRK